MSLKSKHAMLVFFCLSNNSLVKAVESGSSVKQQIQAEIASTQKVQVETNQKLDAMAFVESAQTMSQKLETQSQTSVESKQKAASLSESKIEQQSASQLEANAKWGFLKNIVNIDSFFSSGKESSKASDSKKSSSFMASKQKQMKANQQKLKTKPQEQQNKENTKELSHVDSIDKEIAEADVPKSQNEASTPKIDTQNNQNDKKVIEQKQVKNDKSKVDSRIQQDQKKQSIKPNDKHKNKTKEIKSDIKTKLNLTNTNVKNDTEKKNEKPVIKAVPQPQKVVRKVKVFQLNQIDSNSDQDQNEANNKTNHTSVAQTSSKSERLVTQQDQDVNPNSGDANSQMQETNSQQSVTEWIRPGSVNENPPGADSKELDSVENSVSTPYFEKENSPEVFVKKEVNEADIVDEDHPPIVVRQSVSKRKIKSATDEDHPRAPIQESVAKPKMKDYFKQSKKKSKKQEQSDEQDHKAAEKLEKALEKLNKRSQQVEEALKKFEDASSQAEKLKSENTLESVDAHKKLYESKKKAVMAVKKKNLAQQKFNKVLKKTEERKSFHKDKSNVNPQDLHIKKVSDTENQQQNQNQPAKQHLADKVHDKSKLMNQNAKNKKQKQNNFMSSAQKNKRQAKDLKTQSNEDKEQKQSEKESYQLFTLAKHQGRLTLRHNKLEAGSLSELGTLTEKYNDRSMIVIKDNQIVSSNCYNENAMKSVDYQRLVGFATLEGVLQPQKLQKFNMQPDQRYLTWVEGQANMKDIVWKSFHGLNSQKKATQLFQKHYEHGNGPVIIKISDKDQSLHIMKHNKNQHMPKQALGLGHFITQKLKLYDSMPKSQDE